MFVHDVLGLDSSGRTSSTGILAPCTTLSATLRAIGNAASAIGELSSGTRIFLNMLCPFNFNVLPAVLAGRWVLSRIAFASQALAHAQFSLGLSVLACAGGSAMLFQGTPIQRNK